MTAARSLAILSLAVAMNAPALAAGFPPATPIAADDVVVTTATALATANAPHYTLRFSRNGTAAYDGPLNGRDGHYVANVDFAAVQAAVADANLCERNGIPLFTEGTPRYPRADVLVSLRGADKSKTFNRAADADLPAFAGTLLKVGAKLAWHYDGPAQRESIMRFAR
jgi:hypothetical protein